MTQDARTRPDKTMPNGRKHRLPCLDEFECIYSVLDCPAKSGTKSFLQGIMSLREVLLHHTGVAKRLAVSRLNLLWY